MEAEGEEEREKLSKGWLGVCVCKPCVCVCAVTVR